MTKPAELRFARCDGNEPSGCGHNNTDACQDAVRRTVKAVLRRGRRYTERHILADDLIQDVFAKLQKDCKSRMETHQRAKGVCELSWICIAAARSTLIALRPYRQYATSQRASAGVPCNTGALPMNSRDGDSTALLRLKAAISELPHTDRLVFRLIVEDGLSHTQAASICRMNQSALENRIHQIKKRLENVLQEAGVLGDADIR